MSVVTLVLLVDKLPVIKVMGSPFSSGIESMRSSALQNCGVLENIIIDILRSLSRSASLRE